MAGVNHWTVDPDGELIYKVCDGSWYELRDLFAPETPYNVAVAAIDDLRRTVRWRERQEFDL